MTQWFEQHRNETLLINKQEKGTGKQESIDEDHIHLQLQDLTVRSLNRPDADGYLSNQELILQGIGDVNSDQGEVELPQNVFEIPLDDSITISENPGGLTINTEKATYTITLNN
ncbi:hypothetical protein LGQ02_11055 [Bacillus shivajii]|uniref:hypothetical protein n=1 Tax=Bacillus shivajii TaxID=1983719 RepID=UPI001CFA6AE2|nr:hypothetical protein [Bacillus shivajii]UCZ51422.1 hypothetical protein LGQ02_11055 [Bacillus shivajii]